MQWSVLFFFLPFRIDSTSDISEVIGKAVLSLFDYTKRIFAVLFLYRLVDPKQVSLLDT